MHEGDGGVFWPEILRYLRNAEAYFLTHQTSLGMKFVKVMDVKFFVLERFKGIPLNRR